jgi:hypothetical protein
VVFNENVVRNQVSASRRIDSPEVLRFAQDDKVFKLHIEKGAEKQAWVYAMSGNRDNVLKRSVIFVVLCLTSLLSSGQNAGPTAAPSDRWTEQKANTWYQQQPWLVGSDYIPADAINQLEMWQAESFDPQQIDKELGWAEGLGMNTMRVFLHDLVWQQDAAGFRTRIDSFLTIRPSLESTTRDGCRAPEQTRSAMRRSIPGLRGMCEE